MKLIIEYKGVKRQIEGSFRLCASGKDFATIKSEIALATEREDDFHYGWIEVIANRPEAVPNSPPIPWESKA